MQVSWLWGKHRYLVLNVTIGFQHTKPGQGELLPLLSRGGCMGLPSPPPPQLAPGRYTAALTELQAAHTLRAQYGPCTVTAATAQSPFLHWGALAQHPAPAWALRATAPCCTLTRCSPYHTHVGPHNAVLAQHTCLMYHKNTNWLPTEIREENMHSYSSANYDLLTANFIPMAIAPKAAS